MIRKITSLLIAGIVCGTLTAGADEIEFTYNTDGLIANVYGYNFKETYDVAIRIADPQYVGCRVKGFVVDLPVKEDAVDNITGWLSTELKVTDGVNAPDITTVPGVMDDRLVLNVTFPTPYTITDAGVWVGYSFDITSLKTSQGSYPGAPIAYVKTSDTPEYGLWARSSRKHPEWFNQGAAINGVSDMIVTLDMDFGPDDAAIGLPAESYVKAGEVCDVPVTLTNHGEAPLQDITFSYSIGDYTNTGSVHLSEPIAVDGAKATVNLPVGPVETLGKFPFKVKLETSNGKPNTDPMREAEATMNVWPLIPVTRPLVEEFTGLGCGACPAGYVAMEYLAEKYGDMFVGMAYHCSEYENGMMTCVSDRKLPVPVSSYPYSDINRAVGMYPGDLPFHWEQYAALRSPAAIEADFRWNDDAHTSATVTAKVTFVMDMDNADYRLAFGLTANGLKNPKWKQHNYYSGKSEGYGVESPLWDLFLKGDEWVADLTFNDVVVYCPNAGGEENSIPATVKAGETITYDWTVDMKDVKNIKGEYIINPGATIQGVAILLDNLGESVNCIKTAAMEYHDCEISGIEGISDGNVDIVSTRYYNLQGVAVRNPTKGIYLKSETMSDGTRRTSKVTIQ